MRDPFLKLNSLHFPRCYDFVERISCPSAIAKRLNVNPLKV